MQSKHDEEDDEIQVYKTSRIPEEKRHYQERSSSVTQQRRKVLPVFEDSFSKRLGQRSKSTIRERGLERTNASLTTSKTADASRRTLFNEISRASRTNDVQVDKNCCGWPCVSDETSGLPHIDSQKTSLSTNGRPPTRSFNTKEPRSLCALLTRKLFRQKNNQYLSYQVWEEEWASFREQHEFEMKQIKEMYTSLCQELKKMGSHREDASGESSRHQSVSKSLDSRVDGAPVLGQSRRHVTLNYPSYLRENNRHQRNRRANSAPKTRGNRGLGFIKENSIHVQDPHGSSRTSPDAALFEEIIQVQRDYLRKFVGALIKYDKDRFPTDSSEFEYDSGSLRDVVERLLPHANFAKDWHFRYGIEAWLSRIAFKEFGKSEERGTRARARRIASWAEYQKLSILSPVEAILPTGEDYLLSFHLFCNDKFDTIQDELKWSEEWPDNLVKDFLEAMKHIWRAYKLALAFDPVTSQFSMKTYDAKFVEPLEIPALLETDNLSPFTPQVAFLVEPGFIVLDRIIKCQVYLAPEGSLESS